MVVARERTLPVTLRLSLRPILLALAAALAMSATQAQSNVQRAAQYYESALARFDKKDLAGTVIELKNALRYDPKFLPVHVLMGQALLAQGQAAAAEISFNEALRLGVNRSEVVVPLARAMVAQGKQAEVVEPQRLPTDGLPPGVQAQLLLVKAASFGDLGEPRAALKAVEQARGLAPSSADGWLAEVPLRLRAGQLKEAQEALDRARKLEPASAALQLQFASILHLQGNLTGALDAYGKALATEPDLIDARVARAGLLIDLKRDAEAAKDVAILTRNAAIEPRGWYLAAVLAAREGKSQAVRDACKRIAELLDPVPIAVIRYRPQLLMLGGQAHYSLGEVEKATPYFESFQRLQPGSPAAKILASIYLAQGNQGRAIDTLETYLRTAANDSQAMALLASAYMAQGRSSRAADLMQRALRTHGAAELYTAYGMSLLGTGQAGDAVKQLETAFAKDPAQVQAGAALVGLYLRGGQTTKAVSVAEALLKQQPKNPSFMNLAGMARAQARDYAAARSAFGQALKLDPSLLQARVNLARVEIASGAADHAAALLDEVLKADPFNTEAMYEQAMLADRRGKADDALRWLQRAYDVGGAKDLRGSLALVDYQLRSGKYADALKAAKSLAASAPDSLPVLLALARVQLANGDPAGARTSLTTAGRLAPYEAPVHVEIALLQLAAADLTGAAYSLDKALTAKPDDLRAQVLMTEVEMRQGQLDKAQSRALQVVRREPKLAIGSSLQGDIALARKHPERALEMYRKAFQLEPSSDTAGRLFRTQALVDPKGAKAMAQQWLAKAPKDGAVRRQYAEFLVRSGDMGGARAEYEQLRLLVPKDAEVLNDLANVLARLGEPQAGPIAEQALALAPTNVTIADTAGWIAFQAGRTDRAIQLLRDARLRDPENPVVRYHLAAALAKLGRPAEAREEVTAALNSKLAFDERGPAESLLRTLK